MTKNNDPFRGIEAVAFDLDGTLYPDFRLWLGTDIPFLVRHLSVLIAMARARKKMRLESLGGNFGEVQASLVAGFLKTDSKTAEIRLKAAYAAWEELFSRIKPYRHLAETLDTLRVSGYRLAVLSDLPAEAKLSAMGLGEKFEFSISSEESGWLKPDGRPFLMLAARFGLPSEKILYVGDSAGRDSGGAARVGMKTALLSGKRRDRNAADLVFRRWKDFLSLVPVSFH